MRIRNSSQALAAAGRRRRVHMGGGGGVRLPAGALGVWFADQLKTSPRRVIPNAMDATPVSTSLLGPGRRQFLNPAFWAKGGTLSITDNAATAPDGSGGATIITNAGSAWNLVAVPAAGLTLPAGPYTMGISVRWRGTGSADFKMGNNGALVTKTATASWGRYSTPYTASSSQLPLIGSPDGTSAANFEVCDFELFNGSSDLGPVAIGSHWYLGSYQGASLPTMSGNSVDMSGGGVGNVAFATAQTLSAGTVIYISNRVGLGAGAAYQPVLAAGGDASAWPTFAVGDTLNGMPRIYLNGSSDANIQQSGDLIAPNNAGWYVYGHTWNSTRFTRWVNDVKLLDYATTNAAATFANLDVGFLSNSNYSGSRIHAIAVWSRVLSDAEMRQAYAVLAARAQASSFTLAAPRFMGFAGDSITRGSNGTEGYVFLLGPNASPVIRGAEYGGGGTAIPLDGGQPGLNAIIPPNKKGRTFIVHVFFGANDLRTAALNKSAAQYMTDLQGYLLVLRNAGFDKIVVGTVMSSTLDVDGGTAMDAKRAIVNPAITALVGANIPGTSYTYCDAVVDYAGNANLGANGAANNATYFADKLHPTQTGHALMETILRPVVNGL